jgi:exodeoxyribonuclease VII large subunit
MPRRVALVTSPTGSAVRDMLEVLSRRWPPVEVWVCPVAVQGDGAAWEIAAAIDLLNRLGGPDAAPPKRIDVLIVGRGGGSIEDLWAFNEEVLADAVVRSRIPVVSGVGHEDDVTIIDLVADVRALTPSEAAERVVPDGRKVQEWLREAHGRLRQYACDRLKTARDRLAALAARRCIREPLERVRVGERRLDEWDERLSRAVRQRLDRSRQRLEASAARLETLSPLNVLARGYSLTRSEDGNLIRSPEQVRPGDRLVTQVEHGRIVSRVER